MRRYTPDLPFDDLDRKGNKLHRTLQNIKILLHSFRSVDKNEVKPVGTFISWSFNLWALGDKNSVLGTTPDGLGVWWYRRNRSEFLKALYFSITLHTKVLRNANALADEYKKALSEVTSPIAWEKTFGINK